MPHERPSSSTTGSGLSVAWHALTRETAFQQLGSGRAGLDEHTVAERLTRFGRSELEPEAPKSDLRILLDQFTSPLIYILLVAALVTTLIGEYVDTGVIVAVATVGFTQERKAERSVRALMQLAAPRSIVVRSGRREEVDSAELVPGDLVLLKSGTRVPADLRVVDATALRVDESLLTGESTLVTKTTDPVDAVALASERTSVAHMGSVVASGRGRGLVVATGLATELGRISERISGEATPESPLTRRMNRFANIIAVLVGASAAATFLLGLALGEPAAEMFMTAVALAVAVVPEGLPVALTVTMALGVRRMAHRNAIVRNLPPWRRSAAPTPSGPTRPGP